jgi:hypothetical protein
MKGDRPQTRVIIESIFQIIKNMVTQNDGNVLIYIEQQVTHSG